MDIADDLLRRAKKRAADQRIPLRDLVEDALRLYLSGSTPNKGYKLRWNPEHGKLQPGVDLDDRDSLFDRMGGRR